MTQMIHTAASGLTYSGVKFTTYATRNALFLMAVIALNYTLSRPSPVDLIFFSVLLLSIVYVTLFENVAVTARAIMLVLLVSAWAVFFIIPSLPFLHEPFVPFQLIVKTFVTSIAVGGALISMNWRQRHFEKFMAVYIFSCLIASTLGTLGFLVQHPLLTWDGRAKGLLDDPNMYGSLLIPGMIFCAYFLCRGQGSKIILVPALGMITLGLLLSFSRVAIVAGALCFFAYIAFHNRHRPVRLILYAAGLGVMGVAILGIVSVTSAEFTEKFLDRLTFAKSYDLGETGRYGRYFLVIPMILQNPVGAGVLQLEKIFPEPIHNIWLSAFVNYGWGGGITWVTLVASSIYISVQNFRRTKSELPIALMIGLVGILLCASLHEGEHWRHMWLTYGLIWGFNVSKLMPAIPTAAAQMPKLRAVPRGPRPRAVVTSDGH